MIPVQIAGDSLMGLRDTLLYIPAGLPDVVPDSSLGAMVGDQLRVLTPIYIVGAIIVVACLVAVWWKLRERD